MLFPLLVALQASPALLQDRPPADRPALLILGSPHLANHGRDVANTRIGEIESDARQREIAAIVENLARFRPTRVAVEWKAGDQTGLDAAYRAWRAGRAPLTRSETQQIGFRVAARLGLDRLDAVDWNEPPPGSEADWNYARWAEAHGEGPRLAAIRAAGQARARADEAALPCMTVAGWYRMYNAPAYRARTHRAYYDYAMLGGTVANPGATWAGNWHGRNLKILANLVRIAPRPQDRVLVIYGSGHAPLLDRFARESGAFAVADTLAHLPAARVRTRC